MSRTGWAVLTSWVALAVGGCVIEVEIEGKRCPCVEGFVCDEGLDRCVRQTCTPKVTVTDFAAAWATSNTIRWTWTPVGDEGDLLRYELHVAETREQLGTEAARVYTAEDNPELGAFSIPVVGTIVTSTRSDELEPATDYVAQLRVIDDELCEYGSAVAAETTVPTLPSRLTLFRDELPPGEFDGGLAELAPEHIQLTEDDDGSGGFHLAYAPADDDMCNPDVPEAVDLRGTCGQPLRLRRMNRSLVPDPMQPAAGGLRDGNMGTAFLELQVANDSPVPSYNSVLWLRFGDCFDETYRFLFDGFTFRSQSEYVTLQVPLSALVSADGPLTFPVLDTNAGGETLCSVAIGSAWHRDESRVRIDNIVIRY